MTAYGLMHRDDKAASLQIDEVTGQMIDVHIENPEITPYLGSADKRKMNSWLKNRVIPTQRSQIEKVLAANGCQSPEEFMFKNLGLSMNDSYWLKPDGSELSWDTVNLYDNVKNKIAFGHEYSFTPDASLGGQMPKYIEVNGDIPVLVKHTSAFDGLQCFNEVIASSVHRMQNWQEYVSYEAYRDENGAAAVCPLFTDKNTEFVPALEVIHSQKQPGSLSNYDFYIDICRRGGIENAQIFMDYMTLTDFALTNTDRHLNNFGILRNPETLEFISMAPIFDTGNSMFYNNMVIGRTLPRSRILDIPITAFHDREEKMLHHIQNRECVKLENLPKSSDIRMYLEGMGITPEVADMVSQNYEIKLDFVYEFQHGQNPSRYQEKQKEQKEQKGTSHP